MVGKIINIIQSNPLYWNVSLFIETIFDTHPESNIMYEYSKNYKFNIPYHLNKSLMRN